MTIAFVIPIDLPRHVEYASLLASLSSPVSVVYVVLSRQTEAELWNSLCRESGSKSAISQCRVLILSDVVEDSTITIAEDNRSMATFKKWMGLKMIQDEPYEYIIACDCEVYADKEFVDSLPSQFTFIGDHPGRSEWHKLFTGKTAEETIKRVGSVDGCYSSIYSWWSGLPIYKTSTLKDFLSDVGASDPTSLNFSVFDHLIYQRWLVRKNLLDSRYVCLTHDLKITTGWSLECCGTPEVEEIGLKTLWISRDTRNKYPDIAPGAYIEYHLDRSIFFSKTWVAALS